MNLPLVRIGAVDFRARHAWLGSRVRGRQGYGYPLSHMTYFLVFLLHLFRVTFLGPAAAGRPDSAHKSEFHLQTPFGHEEGCAARERQGIETVVQVTMLQQWSGRRVLFDLAYTIAVRLSCPRRTMAPSNPHTHCHVITPIFDAVPEFPSAEDPLLTYTHGVPNRPCATA